MESADREQPRIGELLVREGLISAQQLTEAIRAQQRSTPYRPLGELCVGLGYLSRGQVKGVLEKHRKRIALGELLVRMGIVSPEEVRQALGDQEKTGKRLGQILQYNRCMTRAALAEALSIQLGIRKIAPGPGMVDPLLLALVAPHFLVSNRLVPLSRVLSADTHREIVTVLMEDPLDLAAIADLGKLFRADIEPAIPATLDLGDFLKEIFDPWGRYRVGPETIARKGTRADTLRVSQARPVASSALCSGVPLRGGTKGRGLTAMRSGNRDEPDRNAEPLHILKLA